MIPSETERKAGLGTSSTAEIETSTVRGGEEDRLAGTVHRLGNRLDRGAGLAHEARAAKAHDDEERVIDPERSANISAKFIAQIEIGEIRVPR